MLLALISHARLDDAAGSRQRLETMRKPRRAYGLACKFRGFASPHTSSSSSCTVADTTQSTRPSPAASVWQANCREDGAYVGVHRTMHLCAHCIGTQAKPADNASRLTPTTRPRPLFRRTLTGSWACSDLFTPPHPRPLTIIALSTLLSSASSLLLSCLVGVFVEL